MVDREKPFGVEAPKFVRACIHLRTKTQYYREEDLQQPAGMVADSPRLSYWCAQTQDARGPDKQFCDPAACRRGRGCHEGPGDLT